MIHNGFLYHFRHQCYGLNVCRAGEHIDGGGFLQLIAAVVVDRDVTREGGLFKPDRFGLVFRVASLI